ncbi:alpha/beta fold hydrolase [Acetivibrio clariflavus]|mgnify:CR=1 FL=1|uniref:Putative hydrolase or acyltransferase of alpha/beta superfamily n=1 Tax=Acetivibrio clariflavus (strain DSM 19732 / NBRC 101661 / EBR45) TaxID=720554 RepID=G8LYJ5_ACECE|nr:alpha/beta hydrolase [Acetivibrio clariflavus]AEV69983.1 putative hydrolase or acyltransferase of alpha/beta superfamily [Acetivibrio clariflavus DSM 19732]
MRVREDSIKIGNTEIDYVSFGRGTQPLVLIPGLSLRDVKGSGTLLAYMYRMFSKDYKVFCIDKKRIIPIDYTVEEIAEDYSMALRALNIEKACILGISQGGMIAQYLALNHSELVQKLVLGVTLSRNNETVISCINEWIHMAESGNFKALGIDILRKTYSEEYIKKYAWLFPILSKIMKPENSERFIALAKSCLTCNTYDRLEEIKCPVYVIGGCKDKVVTGEASYEIASKIGCSIYMYENLGHAAYDEAKDFNKRVYDFFRN